MKLFKTTPQPPDGYAILLDNLKQTTAELQNTYANLENVVDPDLIDYYIYQAKAVQMRYKFLLGCVKKIEGNYSLPPDRSHFTEILYKKAPVTVHIHIIFVYGTARISHPCIYLLGIFHKGCTLVLFRHLYKRSIQPVHDMFRFLHSIQPILVHRP